MVKIDISAISAERRDQRASSSVISGAPTITPIAYALISMPACGIDTCTPSAMTGSRPIGENSVVPMPNAPAASASSGSAALPPGRDGEEVVVVTWWTPVSGGRRHEAVEDSVKCACVTFAEKAVCGRNYLDFMSTMQRAGDAGVRDL